MCLPSDTSSVLSVTSISVHKPFFILQWRLQRFVLTSVLKGAHIPVFITTSNLNANERKNLKKKENAKSIAFASYMATCRFQHKPAVPQHWQWQSVQSIGNIWICDDKI